MLKLSIIIPIYKVADYVAATVKTLFGQHDPAVEYIFVNDATPDNSWQVLQNTLQQYPECQKNSKLIDLPENGGVENARMTGLAQAAGEYIWFVDSDDLIAAGAINAILAVLQKNPVDYLAINLEKIAPGSTIKPINKITYKKLSPEKLFSDIIAHTGKHSAWCNIVKRQLTSDHPMQKTGFKIAEDYVMHCRWSIFAESAAVLENPVYGYVMRPQSAINQSCNFQIMVSVKEAMQYLQKFAATLPPDKKYIFLNGLHNTMVKMRMLFFIDILNNHAKAQFNDLMQYQIEAEYSLIKNIWALPLELQPIMFCDYFKCYGLMRCYTLMAKMLLRLLRKGQP